MYYRVWVNFGITSHLTVYNTSRSWQPFQPLSQKSVAYEQPVNLYLESGATPKDRGVRGENLLTPTKPLAQLSVCRGFAISAAHNPGFPGRLAPRKGLLVLSCSSVARFAEQDELWDDKLIPGTVPWSVYSSTGVMTEIYNRERTDCQMKWSLQECKNYFC